QIYLLTTPTPGTNNSPILINDIVINELMYSPISENNDDEYIELYNKGTNTIDLLGWKIAAGVDYKITNSTAMPPDTYLVIAKSRPNLLAHYPNLAANPAIVLGDYSGSLKNGGERVALSRPEQHVTIQTNTPGHPGQP